MAREVPPAPPNSSATMASTSCAPHPTRLADTALPNCGEERPCVNQIFSPDTRPAHPAAATRPRATPPVPCDLENSRLFEHSAQNA